MEKMLDKIFQEDLRKMSLQEALVKHNLTLKEALSHIPLEHTGVNSCKEKYITERDGKYFIRKYVNGDYIYFGTFNTLEDALKIRDALSENGWDKNKVNDYCKTLGVWRVL